MPASDSPVRACRPRHGPTGRSEKPPISREFVRAGDGARTRDLKLGRFVLREMREHEWLRKAVLGLVSSRVFPHLPGMMCTNCAPAGVAWLCGRVFPVVPEECPARRSAPSDFGSDYRGSGPPFVFASVDSIGSTLSCSPINPRCAAIATAWARLDAPSLAKRFATWRAAVDSATNS
jgi:hypothetical protein